MTAEAAASAREMARGDRSAGSERPARARQGEPGPMPDLAELRASADPRQKWRLGLVLADLAVQTEAPLTHSELMLEAQSVALGLAGIGMKDWLLAEIVERQIVSGDIAAARETTVLIHHPGWKADSLVLIALAGRNDGTDPEGEAQRASDRNAAICAALKIPDPEWRAVTLLSLL